MRIPLLVAINRSLRRKRDKVVLEAEAATSAAELSLRAKGSLACKGCGIRGRTHEPAHVDNNHLNCAPNNFREECSLCHGYGHVGESSLDSPYRGERLGTETLVARIPEVDATDLNLLQRVIGMALAGDVPAEQANAMKLIRHLEGRARDTIEGYGSMAPTEFAQALAMLNDGEYGMRFVPEFRLLFSPKALTDVGGESLREHPDRHPAYWKTLTAQTIKDMVQPTAPMEPNSGTN